MNATLKLVHFISGFLIGLWLKKVQRQCWNLVQYSNHKETYNTKYFYHEQ